MKNRGAWLSFLALLGLSSAMLGCATTAQPEPSTQPEAMTATEAPRSVGVPKAATKPPLRPPPRFMTSVPNFDPLAEHDPIYGTDPLNFEILCCPSHQRGGNRPDPFDPLIQ